MHFNENMIEHNTNCSNYIRIQAEIVFHDSRPSLCKMRPSRTVTFGKRAIKVWCMINNLYNTFPRHLLVYLMSPCPTSGEVL